MAAGYSFVSNQLLYTAAECGLWTETEMYARQHIDMYGLLRDAIADCRGC
jgi:hypothetical protein